MRLIDADALEAYLNKRYDDICERCGSYDSYAYGFGDALWIVETTQAVEDAVVVVRCKDCKYMRIIKDTSGTPFPHCGIAYGMPDVRLSDFCNHGERKTSNEG